ncbi:FxsA family protein [Marinimicrobium sp. C2-29]|uniref:FxsA family protein n=1 Tax=Marinimicrobium sp. C2-29 TaxID=3139825 RepID=UPI003139D5CC
MRVLLLLFIVIPLVEIWLMIEIGREIGAPSTIGLILLTAVIGVLLIRLQGLTTLIRAQSRMASGELPAMEMAEGLVLALCGVCLLIPGFATDLIGFIGLIPPVRRYLLAPWLRGMQIRRGPGPGGPTGPSSGRTLEGDYRREDDPER